MWESKTAHGVGGDRLGNHLNKNSLAPHRKNLALPNSKLLPNLLLKNKEDLLFLSPNEGWESKILGVSRVFHRPQYGKDCILRILVRVWAKKYRGFVDVNFLA